MSATMPQLRLYDGGVADVLGEHAASMRAAFEGAKVVILEELIAGHGAQLTIGGEQTVVDVREGRPMRMMRQTVGAVVFQPEPATEVDTGLVLAGYTESTESDCDDVRDAEGDLQSSGFEVTVGPDLELRYGYRGISTGWLGESALIAAGCLLICHASYPPHQCRYVA